MSTGAEDIERLEKQLGLFDVYTICTGAMFASGFFLLPGIAAAKAGPAVVLAYAISSVLMVPPMLSIAELSTAMPRAGGPYFFVHRSLGPHAGTIGGFGAWVVLVLKSAFALVGMGAYLALFVDVPIRPIAVALTVAFALLNILGAKQTAWLQNVLVATLVAIMTFYVVQGSASLAAAPELLSGRFSPFLPFGLSGLFATVGLVFVSYAGLTKVASVAEEVRDLDRTLPLGMILSLVTVTVTYVVGVWVMVGTLDPGELREDLTPVATAGEAFLDWLPEPVGLVLVVVAAIAAFASTANAGIMSASRFPLAMARDRLAWSGFEHIWRFGTPAVAVAATAGLMIASILLLDVETLASLASAFLLLIFALINLAVIIMRESKVESYAPGFRSPLYPWMQWAGIASALALIIVLGPFYIAFVVVVVVASSLWYRFYARGRVPRRGAMYALFRRLGTLDEPGLDHELWRILQEHDTAGDATFDEIIARAMVVQREEVASFRELAEHVAREIAEREAIDRGEATERIVVVRDDPVVPEAGYAAIYDVALPGLDHSEIVLARVSAGVRITVGRHFPGHDPAAELDRDDDHVRGRSRRVSAILFLFGPEGRVTSHLRILAELAAQVDVPGFTDRWRLADDEQELREVLLRRERFISLEIRDRGPTAQLIDTPVREMDLPGGTLVALVRRGDRGLIARGDTQLRAGDRITIIGTPDDIETLYGRYGAGDGATRGRGRGADPA